MSNKYFIVMQIRGELFNRCGKVRGFDKMSIQFILGALFGMLLTVSIAIAIEVNDDDDDDKLY